MFYLPSILLALGLAVWAETLGAPRPPAIWPAGLGLLLLCLAPYALLWLGRRQQRPSLSWMLRRAIDWLPLAGQAGLLFAADWLGAVQRATGFEISLYGWPRPSSLLAILPFGLVALAALDAGTRWGLPRGPVRRSLVRFQVRQLAVGLGALMLGVLFCQPLYLHRTLRVWVDEFGPAGALWTAWLALAFGLGFPFLLRFGLGLRPLPEGPLERRFADLASRASFDPGRLCLWPTGGLIANAAIVGFVPLGRLVLFTDAILAELAPEELEAVYAHEIGHATRRHVLLYTVFSLAVLGQFPGLMGLAEIAGLPAGPVLELAVFAPLLALWLGLFGRLSRRSELDADLVALSLCGDRRPLISALERVTGRASRRRTSWRHFSTDRRILFLNAASRHPEVGANLRRGLGRWRNWSFGLLALAALGAALSAWRSLPVDHLFVDLRLGRYGSASARLAGPLLDREEHASWQRLADLGLELAPAGELPSAEACLSAARSAFAAGDLDRARAALDLGLLADQPGLEAAARVLAGPAGEPSGPESPGPVWVWPPDAPAPLPGAAR